MRRRRTRKRIGSFNVRSANNTRKKAGVGDPPAAPGDKASFVLVLKAPRRMLLMRGDRVQREYEISLGFDPKGPKRHYRDGRTPEGRYVIDSRLANSAFHRALHISYPNDADVAFAARAGVAPGSGVMIHGLPNGEAWVGDAHRSYDWTNGCIAVTDDEMDEIWGLVDDGTPIEIRP